MTTLAADCEQAAEMLEQIVLQFEAIGWRDHASYVQTMASHLLIYRRQLEAKMHPKKEETNDN